MGSFWAAGFSQVASKTIEEAIDASKELVQGHLGEIDSTLEKIKEKSAALDDVLAAVSQQVGKIAEGQANSDEATSVEEVGDNERNIGAQPSVGHDPVPHKSDIRDLWLLVRDHLEMLASDPDVDGRTRAKYMRIDRRSYTDLITSMAIDGLLAQPQAAAAREAYSMWNSFKPRGQNSPPTATDIEIMRGFAKVVTGGNVVSA